MHARLRKPGASPGGFKSDARIAVVRALHGLGDMLCAVPALAALRSSYPQSHITLIGLPSCQWLLRRFGSLLDSLLPFPGFPGIPEHPYSPRALASFLDSLRSRPFNLAIQMHGSGAVSNAFTSLLGADSTAGLFEPGHHRPSRGEFFPYPHHGSEVHRCLYLTDLLDCPASSDQVFFPVTSDDRAALFDHPSLQPALSARFVCIHAGARDSARRWPAEYFAWVADALAARGFEVILTGTAAERAAAEAVAAHMRAQPVNAAGDTSLGVLAAMLERATLLVTNDTGVSHLAAAMRTPSVIVFLASNPDRWAPIDRELHRPVVARDLAAPPLRRMRVSRASLPEPSEVLDEASQLLTRGAAYAS